MLRFIGWYRWSIATKILIPFLALSVISIAIISYFALSYIEDLGDHAQQTSLSLGEKAIQDSTAHLNSLGENIVMQRAEDVAKQVEMYLEMAPLEGLEELRGDSQLRQIVVQPVGTTGYTTLIDPENAVIVIHKYPGQEKDISPLQEKLPSFWALIESSRNGEVISGYYNWLEVDGSVTEKYAGLAPVRTGDGRVLTLWATTYIEEFSRPAEETKEQINAAILESGSYISRRVADIQKLFIIIFIFVVLVVTLLALLLSRAITSPILSLQKGAGEIGRGRLDYQLALKSQDELGSLAEAFNNMSADLKNHIEELKSTAAENIAKEKVIQDNLRLYVQKVNQAQEAERKRVARELHDETVQSLIVASRNLEELAAQHPGQSPQKIREEILEVIKGVRRFSQELRPSILDDLGLIPAVAWLARDITGNYGIKVTTEIEGDKRELPAESELILFRIIQEALNNVRKHSQATKAQVRVTFSDSIVRVTVRDNGVGFNMPEGLGHLAGKGKLGLVGIQERVQLLGGTLDIQSHPGEGTALTVEIPL